MPDAVRIVKIDMDNIVKDPSFESAWAVYAYLDKAPDRRWGDYFDYAYRNMVNTDKRPLRLEGDRIRVVYAKGDNLQSHIDFVKGVVNTANSYNNFADEEDNI